MTKLLTSLAVASFSLIPSVAHAGPTLTYGFKSVAYSQITCIQKAESKLIQISASNISRNNIINIFGEYPDTTIGIMCRNNGEVLVTVSGKDAYLYRDEIMNSF
jgi:predicted Zn-dependent protease